MSSVDLDAIITAGQQAQIIGLTEADCPYDQYSREGQAWLQGFYDSEEEEEDA